MVAMMENIDSESLGLERLSNKGSCLELVFDYENAHIAAIGRLAQARANIVMHVHWAILSNQMPRPVVKDRCDMQWASSGRRNESHLPSLAPPRNRLTPDSWINR
jgi:hypothetical protein